MIRFVLGRPSGVFPGVIVFSSLCDTKTGQSGRPLLVAIPMSNMLGVIAAFLMRINWLGYAGWRWLLILEGVPAIVAGLVTFATDRLAEGRAMAARRRTQMDHGRTGA